MPTRVRPPVAAAALLGLMTAVVPPSSDADPAARIAVNNQDGGYLVTATFAVDQPPSAVLAVLTDYEQIPLIAPGIQVSTVIERNGTHALVEQEAVARVMLFSKRVHLLLEIDEYPGALRFRDRSGRSFTRYEGGWTVHGDDMATQVAYELFADPAFSVPGFILERLLQRDARDMIQRLRTEIGTRATREAAGL